MNTSNKKFVKRWRKTRRKGFLRYLIRKGLKVGIISAPIGLFLIYFDTDHKIIFKDILLEGLLIFFITGILYAVVSWFINNLVYSELRY